MDPTPWEVIVVAVRAEMDVKNWLKVRSVLQLMLNKGIIVRTKDLNKEEYFAVTAPLVRGVK
jgi:hypothetical protein